MVSRIHHRHLSLALSVRHCGRAVVGGVALLSSACLDLERADSFREGEVRVTVVDGNGAPVAGARVSIEGTNLGSETNDVGLGVVSGLVVGDYAVRVSVDEDGDGIAEAGAVRGEASIRRAPLRGIERLTAFELPTTAVAATGGIGGVVTNCADDEICRVVAFRHMTLGMVGGRTRDVALPVEGSAGVGADGTWRIDGLVPGTVTLLALASTRATALQPLQQLIAASRPTRFAVVDADVGRTNVAIAVDTEVPAGGVTATLEVAADDLERAQGSVGFLVPGTLTDVSPALVGAFAGLTAEQPTAELQVPVSVFDMNADTGSVGGQLGLMAGVPGIGALLPLVLGLPAADDAACTDIDADCLCDRLDPFPGCTSNDPTDCQPAAPVTCD